MVYNINNLNNVSFDSISNGIYDVIKESNIEYNNIVNESEIIYESIDIKSYWNAFIEWVKNFAKKIAQIVNNLIIKLLGFIKFDKAFIDKYKKSAKTDISKVKDYEGYEYLINGKDLNQFDGLDAVDNRIIKGNKIFDINILKNLINNIDILNMEEYKKFKEDSNTDYESAIENARGDALNYDCYIKASEFSDDLFKYFRNNKDKKDKLENINLNNQLSIVENSSKMIRDVNSCLDKYKKITNTITSSSKNMTFTNSVASNFNKELNKKEIEKANIITEYTQIFARYAKGKQEILSQITIAYVTALNDRYKQAKSILTAVMTNGESDNNKSEEQQVQHNSASLISNINFK